MDATIIQGMKRLRVLTPCDFVNMDEFAQDLTTALEESYPILKTSKSSKKDKSSKSSKKDKPSKSSKKQRSKSNKDRIILSSSQPKSSAFSDYTESSQDDESRPPHEMSATGSLLLSDSDENNSNHYPHSFLAWRCSITNIGESDSFNENFHPSREPRRKRKFKRMTVTPGTFVENELLLKAPLLADKQISSLASIKYKGNFKRFNKDKIKNNSEIYESAIGFCGKRKRSTREKRIEINDINAFHPELYFMDCENVTKYVEVSGPSSSDSECGFMTNDEGREADDEQSDFFNEAGPSYGIPGKNALPKINKHAARQIRSGHRRLAKSSVSSLTEEDKIYLMDVSSKERKYPFTFNENSSGNPVFNDIKRRRKMPPATNTFHGFNELSEAMLQEENNDHIMHITTWKSGNTLQFDGFNSAYKNIVKAKIGLECGLERNLARTSQIYHQPSLYLQDFTNVKEHSENYLSLISPSIANLMPQINDDSGTRLNK